MMRMTLAWMSVLVAAVLVLTAVLHSAEALSRDNLSGASAVSSAVASRESGRLAGLDDAVGSALDRVGDIGVSEASEVVTILSTVDGSLHGVDQHMRRVWTTSTGGPMVSAQNRAQGEAGASIQPEGDLGYEGEGDESDAHDAGRYSVLPATDGSIMYHNHDGMRKTSVTARFLAEQAPFVSNEGLVFTGKRTTKVVGLDLSSGKVLHDFSGKASAGGALQGTEALGGGAKKLPSAVGAGTGAVSRGSAVWFGRVDYSVRAVRSDSGEEQFNLSYSELMPLEQAGLVGAAGSADGRRVGTGKVVGLLGSGASGGRRTGAKLPMLPSPSNTIPKHEAEDWEQEGGQEGEGEGEGRGAVALVSMPDGELYLSDLEGNVLEKIPIGLRSPVINAFNLKKSGKGGSKEVGMDIRSINVHHRMFAAAGVGAGLDGEGEYEKLVLVQPLVDALGDGASGGGGDVPLYVLEVEVIPPPASPKQSPLPGSPADVGVPVGEEGEDQSEGEGEAEGSDSRRQAGNDTSRAGASQQGRGRGRGRGRVRGRGVNSTAVSTKGKAEAQAAAQAQRRPLTRHGSGPAYGHGQKLRYGRGLGRGINPLSAAAKAKEQAAAELAAWEGHPTEWGTGATDTGDTGEGWQSAAAYTEEQGWALLDAEATAEAEAQAEARVPPSERICAAEQGAHYPPLQDGLCSAMGQAFHCSSCGAEQAALSLCAHLPSPPSPASAASTPSVRGPHRLREDVYSGDLFLPSLLSQHLFSGVLPGYKSPLELDAPRRDQGRRRYGYDFDEDDDDFSPGRGPRSSLGERVQLYFAKLAGILEQLLLYAAVTALLAFLSLCWAVYYLRSSKQYAHLLPAKANYPAQLAYSLRLLLDKALEGAGVLPPLMRTASQQRLRSGSGTGFGSAVKPALSQVESVDAQGRRTTQVGQLLVHMDQVLGYGSHGTVVYRGDLHGRPLAVKRILSQFTRSADREISLLMQSDGHPNVVRYYTKEAQADFVYLGLQLCEMSLKDFIVRIKSKSIGSGSSSGSGGSGGAGAEDEAQGAGVAPRPRAISDKVKGGLLQIATGLAHLHSQRIVHRDIKPHNILCALPQEGAESADAAPADALAISAVEEGESEQLDGLSEYVLKISDMGLSKQLGRDDHSFSSMSFSMSMALSAQVELQKRRAGQGGDAVSDASFARQQKSLAMMQAAVGTVGWQAPELISHRYANPPTSTDAAPAEVKDGSAGEGEGEGEGGETDSDGSDEEEDGDGEEDGVGTGKGAGEEEEGEGEEASFGKFDAEGTGTVAIPGSPKLAGPLSAVRKHRQRRDQKKRTLTVDVFSLGCVFYFAASLGEHPFGEWFEREANIIAGKADLSLVAHDPSALDLVCWMLHPDPLQRPTSREVCTHAFFWSHGKRLEFLVEFSDRLEREEPDAAIVLAVETGAAGVIGTRWDRRLDALLLEDMGRYRKYDACSLRDLLRVIRNKRHHFHELSAELKGAMGALPHGFLHYFDVRFPQLVLHCADVASVYLAGEPLFAAFVHSTSAARRRRVRKAVQGGPRLGAPGSGAGAGGGDVEVEGSEDWVVSSASVSVPPRHASPLPDMSPDSSPSIPAPTPAFAAPTAEAASSFALAPPSASTEAPAPAAVPAATAVSAPEEALEVVVWQGSSLANSLRRTGWWRGAADWVDGSAVAGMAGASTGAGGGKKARASHLLKSSCDLKYRTRLCSHWELTQGGSCPMRKKGKCIFAHGPLELRVKETRRDRWGRDAAGGAGNGGAAGSQQGQLRFSGGEDVLGAARSSEKMRASDPLAPAPASPGMGMGMGMGMGGRFAQQGQYSMGQQQQQPYMVPMYYAYPQHAQPSYQNYPGVQGQDSAVSSAEAGKVAGAAGGVGAAAAGGGGGAGGAGASPS